MIPEEIRQRIEPAIERLVRRMEEVITTLWEEQRRAGGLSSMDWHNVQLNALLSLLASKVARAALTDTVNPDAPEMEGVFRQHVWELGVRVTKVLDDWMFGSRSGKPWRKAH